MNDYKCVSCQTPLENDDFICMSCYTKALAITASEQVRTVRPVASSLDDNKATFLISSLTLRDWFAGMTMAGMNYAPDYTKGPCNSATANRAYAIADELLLAREKGGVSQ